MCVLQHNIERKAAKAPCACMVQWMRHMRSRSRVSEFVSCRPSASTVNYPTRKPTPRISNGCYYTLAATALKLLLLLLCSCYYCSHLLAVVEVGELEGVLRRTQRLLVRDDLEALNHPLNHLVLCSVGYDCEVGAAAVGWWLGTAGCRRVSGDENCAPCHTSHSLATKHQ